MLHGCQFMVFSYPNILLNDNKNKILNRNLTSNYNWSAVRIKGLILMNFGQNNLAVACMYGAKILRPNYFDIYTFTDIL